MKTKKMSRKLTAMWQLVIATMLFVSACADNSRQMGALGQGYTPPGGNTGGSGGTTNTDGGNPGGTTCTSPQATCQSSTTACDVNLNTDPQNCGICGLVCGSGKTCKAGHCADASPVNTCTPTASTEKCDYTDDDCNGTVDDGFNLNSDVNNCGVCGHACGNDQNCVSGHCAWITPPNKCTPSQEVCDGIDNDCNGTIDDNFNLLDDANNCGICGHVCGTGQKCTNGACAYITPPNKCTPSAEKCDNVDNDCNSTIDDGFNLQNDSKNCGACNNACAANQSCVSGHCAWNSPVDTCTPSSTPEVCNNKDDNCNGTIDEGFDLQSDPLNCGKCGRVCPGGAQCLNGICYNPVNVDTCTPTSSAEICNNIDDNCNGFIDEGINLNTDKNNCGVCGNVCGANQVCSAGHCQYTTPQNSCMPTSSTEVCNYKDDDCNGAIDENFDMSTDPANCGACGHACDTDQVCSGGHCQWIKPQSSCTPSQEVCNNVDDNCNLTIDEGFNTQIDPNNCGACGNVCATGQSCVNGHCALNVPVSNCIPSPEVCDGIDNNCNGTIDETFDLQSDPANCGKCGHACDPGQTCVSAQCAWITPPNVCTPSTEVCDNKDDDCDGVIDNGFVLSNDAANCGFCGHACDAGQYCKNGACAWITPVNNCTSSQEVCDDADDDCDGIIDNGFDKATDINNCGKCGVVCGAGQTCSNGHCTNIVPTNLCVPTSETCNNKDDNCNGVVDEGIDKMSDPANCGSCGHVCPSGQYCDGGHCALVVPDNTCTPTSTAETCNGKDDNCNGAIDEGIDLNTDANNCGYCGNACAAGQVCDQAHCKWVMTQSACTSSPEVCDGIDNNCNGYIDDGFNLSSDVNNCGTCGNVCGAGEWCNNGHCAYVTLPNNCTPTTEVCDGADNDCNGLIDDTFNLNTDANNCGTCGHVCPSGSVCQNALCTYITPPNICNPAPAELCNNADDDCDGQIDEGFDLKNDPLNCGMCGNACASGQFCTQGHCAWKTPRSSCKATTEVCNGIDDNCNQVIDEGFNLLSDSNNCGSCGNSCASGQTCENGKCAWITPPSKCTPSTEVCDYVDNNCNGVIDENFDLKKDSKNCGLCGHACASGQYCSNGHCALITPLSVCTSVAETCNGIDDDCDGLIDENFNLSSDKNNCGKCGNKCAANQNCQNGKCQTP